MNCKAVRMLLALALTCAITTPAWAEPVATTGTGAIFAIGMGARPLSMGGAFIGVADDENALFYNPAGMVYLKQKGVTSMYSTQYDVTRYGGLALSGGGYGIGTLYLDSMAISGVGNDSEIIDDFDYVNIAWLAGLARRIGHVAVGVRGKYLTLRSAELDADSTLHEVTGQGFAADAGVLVKLGPLGLGAVYENIFSKPMAFSNDTEEQWEQRLSIGASLSLGSVLLAVDLEDLNGAQKQIHAGGEVMLGPLGLRAGLNAPLTEDSGASLLESADLTAGAGIYLGGLRIEYAYLMPKELPETHRLSLGIRF